MCRISRWTLLIAVSLGGCLPVHNPSATAEYDRRVVVASMRVAQLEESLGDTEARLAQAEEWIRVRGQVESQQLENIEQVNEAVRQMRGDIEVLQHGLDALREELGLLQLDSERRMLHAERRLEQLEKFLGVKPPPPPTDEELGILPEEPGESDVSETDGAEEPQVEPPAQVEPPEDLAGYLELGIEHMRAGRQAVARAVFEKAIATHTGEEGLDEVRYRLAETWFNDESWQKAAIAFQGVLDNHRESTWAPWSMYRQGECFQKMGDAAAARLFYDELVRLFPRSDAAKDARKALQEL
ncbi:MAG: tetratricopeptide repeat protein [Deltaproteobacteria bacterium]|nr:tetratricopeptide repeat protein [Deltaproteobacteria bacterium]